jgi:KDO2-lipid IV(A) lauroyltransferase
LGQKTACLHGIEEYSKLYNLPIVYAKIMRVKRGYYEVFLKWIIQESEDAEKGESTALFMKELESSIIQEPGNWLWSHKRWKAKYEGQEIYIVNPEKN